MNSILFGWMGWADLKASQDDGFQGNGPLGTTLLKGDFSSIVILVSRGFQEGCHPYKRWLDTLCQGKIDIQMHETNLEDPTNYKEIYTLAFKIISKSMASLKPKPQIFFQLSAGTPQMQVCWILINQEIKATLLQSTPEGVVKKVDFPFDITARMIEKKIDLVHPGGTAFVYCCDKMKKLVRQIDTLAPLSKPVLIEGESGTGKEELAQRLHQKGKYPAKEKFIAINCGAIPQNLVESELFGHVKGAFTGADKDRKGKIELSHNGTLFLDEIGEMTLDAQTKLLRVIQTGEVLPLGAHPKDTRKVNFRLVTATNRHLLKEVTKGNFREDLYYRVGVLYVVSPPLRQRGKMEIQMLTRHFIEEFNKEFKTVSGYNEKEISPEAMALMCSHDWPGNIRELSNVIYRAAIWEPITPIISETALRDALFPHGEESVGKGHILNRLETRERVDLNAIIDEVKHHYVTQALTITNGVKGHAEKLLGLKRNNLNSLLKKLDMDEDCV